MKRRDWTPWALPTDRLTDVHVLVLDDGLARLDTLRGLKVLVMVRAGW